NLTGMGLNPILTPFTALYVLMLAILGPLFAKESKTIYKLLNKVFKWDKKLAKEKEKQKERVEVAEK
ncbi:cation/H(+) antiporter, partial [Geobacillus thermodenitrificans]